MQFKNILSDDAVTEEIGHRIAAARLEGQMTQAQLAKAAGVSKRTVERLEDGIPTQLGNLIRCLRVLDRLEGLERLLPETRVNPIDLLAGHRAPRSRARPPRGDGTSRKAERPSTQWVWGDKE